MGQSPAQTYFDIPIDKNSSEYLRNKLKVKSLEARQQIFEKHSRLEKLLKEKGLELGQIRKHSAKLIGAGALTGSLLLTPLGDYKILPTPDDIISTFRIENPDIEKKDKLLTNILQSTLPKKPRPLARNEEKILEQIFKNVLGVSAKASLEGEHLNTTYGLIGAEQHLRRYPGDSLSLHGDKEMLKEGMAPGLGAFGYFAKSSQNLTEGLGEAEKWYAVVQTLYLPDWNKRQPYLKDWYKYRKVLIVNTQNGKAVVAAVADSGPAAWTGKQFGGSPEVMDYLGGEKYKKGPVIIFFVNDPENKVPLGPID